jgi:transposase InsO family protein
MTYHPRAKLTRLQRLELVKAIERGKSLKAAAAGFSVAPATAHKWWHRWRGASAHERASLTCLEDRSCRPARSPRMLCVREQRRICAARERTGWGPRLIAGAVGHPHSTVHATLRRHGLSRRPRPRREAVVRYEWPCPGELLHMDTKRYPRFLRPGHAVTGDRTRTSADRRAAVGYDFAHSVVDDHSRLAYSELHDDERAPSVTGFVERMLDRLAGRGINVKRILTDNAWCYTRNRALRELLAARGIRHLTIDPYRPQTNGKVERFHQTMEREWAKGMTYASHDARNAALPHWLRYYNERRPHSSLGGRSPISRVHDVLGQDS